MMNDDPGYLGTTVEERETGLYDGMTEAEWKEIAAEERAELEEDKDEMVRVGVRMALWNPDDMDVSGWSVVRFLKRRLYALKLAICVDLGLWFDERVHGDYYDLNPVRVITVHSAQLYAGWEEDYLDVGRGMFTGWWYCLNHDGEWERWLSG